VTSANVTYIDYPLHLFVVHWSYWYWNSNSTAQ